MKINKKIAVLLIATFMALSFLIVPVLADTNTTWTTPANIDTSTVSYRAISIAVDAQGNPHIAYFNNNGPMDYASWTGSTWNIQQVTGDISGSFLSLVLDSSGNPHIAYAGSGGLSYISGTNSLGSAWTTPQVVDSTPYSGWLCSLALNQNGNPAISYFVGFANQIKYASWTSSGGWQTALITTISGGYNTYRAWTSLAFDQAGNPHVAYEDMYNNKLDYASLSGSTWTTTTIDSTDGTGISLGFNPVTGNAAVSYYDGTTENLKFATQTGSTWSIQVVDTGVGGYDPQATSLAFDPRCGNPAIAYYDASNDQLKYAYMMSSQTWNIEVIDSSNVDDTGQGTNEVGYQATLAFDLTGAPHVAYFRNYNYWDDPQEDDMITICQLMYAVGTPADIGMFKLPESSLGAAMALTVSLVAFVGFVSVKKIKAKSI